MQPPLSYVPCKHALASAVTVAITDVDRSRSWGWWIVTPMHMRLAAKINIEYIRGRASTLTYVSLPSVELLP